MGGFVGFTGTIPIGAPAAQGLQGPPGPPGAPGSGVALFRVQPPVSIGQYTPMSIVDGVPVRADSADATQAGNVAGIASNSVQAGGDLDIQFSGAITNSGWNWNNGPVFLGPSGTLSQTAPTVGFCQIIGIPINPTTLLVQLQPPVVLAA